jgi:orotidine-5'-phosphate decarboxylase
MELYYAEGPSIVREIKARGHKIFLDLKLHDIPNTVKKAMSVLSNLDVDITNLHAAGTTAMMKGALEGLTRPDGTRPLLIAVTQLTSTDQEAMEKDLGPIDPLLESGQIHLCREWLNEKIHKYGCLRLPREVIANVCGQELSAAPLLRYFTDKYTKICGLE